jgi:site-specific recombinase XerD
MSLLYNTGARVSEIIGVKLADVVLDGAPCMHLHGKGRKQRAIPLWKSTAQHIRAWLRANPALGADSALLPNRDGGTMTRFNVTRRLQLAVQSASTRMASLTNNSISNSIKH